MSDIIAMYEALEMRFKAECDRAAKLERELNEAKSLEGYRIMAKHVCDALEERDSARGVIEHQFQQIKKQFEDEAVLKTELDLARQCASDNGDWFDSLVSDLAEILKCDPKPHVILEVVKHLKKGKP